MPVPMGGIIAASAHAMQEARKRREAAAQKRQDEESNHTCTKDTPREHSAHGCLPKKE